MERQGQEEAGAWIGRKHGEVGVKERQGAGRGRGREKQSKHILCVPPYILRKVITFKNIFYLTHW